MIALTHNNIRPCVRAKPYPADTMRESEARHAIMGAADEFDLEALTKARVSILEWQERAQLLATYLAIGLHGGR